MTKGGGGLEQNIFLMIEVKEGIFLAGTREIVSPQGQIPFISSFLQSLILYQDFNFSVIS